MSNAAFLSISSPLPDQAWYCGNPRGLRASQKLLARPQAIVICIIAAYDVLIERQILPAQGASGCKNWMKCKVALLLSWLGQMSPVQ